MEWYVQRLGAAALPNWHGDGASYVGEGARCSLCAGWLKRTSFDEGIRRAGDVRNTADFKFRVRCHEYVQASWAKKQK